MINTDKLGGLNPCANNNKVGKHGGHGTCISFVRVRGAYLGLGLRTVGRQGRLLRLRVKDCRAPGAPT